MFAILVFALISCIPTCMALRMMSNSSFSRIMSKVIIVGRDSLFRGKFEELPVVQHLEVDPVIMAVRRVYP